MTAGGALADPTRGELRSRVISGLGWKMASQGASQVTNAVVMVIIARLLSPEQFGVAGMVLVVTAFTVTLSDCGLGLALIQRESISEIDRSTCFWGSTVVGAAVTAALLAVAPLVASFYRTPEVARLLDVLAFSFLITALGSTHRSLQMRAMNFRMLEIRGIVATLVSACVTLVVASLGGGAWALVAEEMVLVGVGTAALWIAGGWRPRFIFSWAVFRELSSFGFRYLGGTTFLTLNQNADNVLVGRVLGSAALGIYSIAYSVILIPLSRLAYPVHTLLSPAFARMKEDREALGQSWMRATRLLGILLLPVMVTACVTAPALVEVLFGPKWRSAVPVIRILAIVCIIMGIQGVADVVMQALGEMRKFARMGAFSFALNMTAFVIGIQWGLVGMALAFAISTLTYFLIYTAMVGRAVGISGRAIIVCLGSLVQAALILAVSEFAIYTLLADAGAGPINCLVGTTLVGALPFALYCLWRENDIVSEIRQTFASTRRRAKPVKPEPATL